MESLLGLLLFSFVVACYIQRQKCIKQKRPFFRLGKSQNRTKPIKLSTPPNRRPAINSARRRFLDTQKKSTRADLVDRLNLLAGNELTASRLIQNIKQSNHEKDLNWCIEKAISDIERDRK